MSKKKPGGFYAVGVGRNVGIFNTWEECENSVKGFPNAKFKKFSSKEDAEGFVDSWSSGAAQVNKPSNYNLKINNSAGPSQAKCQSQTQSVILGGKRPLFKSMSSDEKLECLIESSKRDRERSTKLLESPIEIHPTKRLKYDPSSLNSVDRAKADTCFLPFIVDDEEFVNVYTDGACSQNGQKNAHAGVGVWFGDNHPLNISRPVVGPATNNNAEIQAARLAVELAVKAGFKKLKINTDSAFLISCMTEYLHKWKKNGYKLTTGGDVKNRTELEKLDKSLDKITVKWNKVPAHSGVHGNEMADKLAVEGAARNV